MHFALPPRKTSQAPYAAAPRHTSHLRQQQVRFAGYVVCGLLTLYLFLHYVPLSSPLAASVSSGTPPVVIVTVFDEQQMSEEYISNIKANREDYALRQGLHNPLEWHELIADNLHLRLQELLHQRVQLHSVHGAVSFFMDPDSCFTPRPHEISR
jgi:hypothetical protein